MTVARKAFVVAVSYFIFLFMTEQLYNLYMAHMCLKLIWLTNIIQYWTQTTLFINFLIDSYFQS